MENNLPCYEKVFGEKSEKIVTVQTDLQEYLPNAVKVVKITATPVTDGYEDGKDSLGIRGHIVFSVVYLSDFKDKLKNAVFTEEFSHSFPARGIGDTVTNGGFAEWNIQLSEEKGQVLSPRKLGLSCKAAISVSAVAVKNTEVTEIPQDKSIQKLCSKADILNVQKLNEYEYNIEENIPLEEGMPKIREIVFSECSISCIGASINSGNVNYYGELFFTCLYLGEDTEDGEQYISFGKAIPFSANVPESNIPQDPFILCKATVTDVSASPMQDSYGETSICSAHIGICIGAKVYGTSETEVLCDVFSTKHDCGCEIKDIGYDTFIGKGIETLNVSESIRTNLGSMTGIVSQIASVSVLSTELSGKEPVCSMRADLKLLGTNELGGLESINTSFQFRAPSGIELEDINDKCRFDTSVYVSSCRCKIENGEIKCDLTLELQIAAYSRKTAKTVTAMTLDREYELCRDRSEYMICYPAEDETIWSISKKYKVSPEALLSANGMSRNDSELSEKRVVVIPKYSS